MSDNSSPIESAPDTRADAPVAHNLPEYTVSEIGAALKHTIETGFGRVRVRGEISGFKRAASGHLYFTLKDERAVIDSVCWRGVAGGLSIRPEDGLEVICTGRVTAYPSRSRYQIVIESIELAGEGALLKLLEDRKRKLEAEGLFDPALKKPIPFLPEVIGVVTSPTGAVIRDILHRLADRFPRHVLLWPVRVQGEAAAGEIAAAIEGFNRLTASGDVPRPDLLIVARGGGSLEDLWAFNEEVVVRAAAASDIPLISAVGHETDTTLIDFAADRRAPTPTAAAEMAVPVRAELLAQVLDDARRLVSAVNRKTTEEARWLDALDKRLGDPRRLLEAPAQRLDHAAERLGLGPRHLVALGTARLDRAAAGLRPKSLGDRIGQGKTAVGNAGAALGRAGSRAITDAQRRLEAMAGLLESLSYQRVLERGFALVRDTAGAPLTAAAATRPGMEIAIRFQDGETGAVVAGAPRRTKPKAKAKPDRRGGGGDGDEPQGSLL
jgi:exodeoxyribonuclease VII large subunit